MRTGGQLLAGSGDLFGRGGDRPHQAAHLSVQFVKGQRHFAKLILAGQKSLIDILGKIAVGHDAQTKGCSLNRFGKLLAGHCGKDNRQ